MADIALIIVDVQHDFVDGALGGPGRRAVIDPLDRLCNEADFIVSSLDWHPANHCSFAAEPTFTDGSWPAHCVQGSHGAKLHPTLAWLSHEFVFKGENPDCEAYSAFDGFNSQGRSLEALLAERAIEKVLIGGLCTDYCVLATALDAVRIGYDTTVVTGACAGVARATTVAAENRMVAEGVTLR
jgi:nicotinamidase-related amidase